MSWHGPGSLVTIKERLTADRYIDIVNDNIMSSAMDMGVQSDSSSSRISIQNIQQKKQNANSKK